MVKIILYWHNNSFCGFELSGHSGYGEKGKDIVCAGISAVTQTAVIGLKYYLGEEKVSLQVEDGFLRCHFNVENLSKNEANNAQVIIKTMLLGLENIREGYSGYLQIEKRRCEGC